MDNGRGKEDGILLRNSVTGMDANIADEAKRSASTHKKASYHTITELLGHKFWEEANWIEIVCEVLFHIKRRETTISLEIYAGLIQFVSCMYVLPVIPGQLLNAGYDEDSTYVVTASNCYLICVV